MQSPRATPEPARDDCFAEAILLVDRPALLDLFAASGEVASGRMALVCIDGTPSPSIASVRRGLRAGCRPPVLYIHDAATVIYPFTIEPMATMLEHRGSEPFMYFDLGLPPLGATSRRFGDPTLPRDKLVFELEAIPPRRSSATASSPRAD